MVAGKLKTANGVPVNALIFLKSLDAEPFVSLG
jgi:hypothetical protein